MTYRAKTLEGQARIFRAACGHLGLEILRALEPVTRPTLAVLGRVAKQVGL